MRRALKVLTRTIGVLLAVLLAGYGTTAQGVDLYQGEVVVEDQSSQARSEGLSRALAQVLVKTTGNPEAPEVPAVGRFLPQAPQYVQQFQYRTEERPRLDDSPPARVMLLSARFDPAAVERILREAGLSRWGQERPTVLVWLVMQTDQGRELIGAERPLVTDAVHRAAKHRGLPVLLPLLDLADQQAVSERELWGGFTESLADASARYGTQTFLLGRIEGEADDRQGRWTLYDQGRESHFETTRASLESVIEQGLAGAANALGQRYAVPVTEQAGSSILVAVEGVDDLGDYDRVLDYLGGLTLVRRAELEAVQGKTMSLRLSLNAGLDRLDQTVDLGEVLAPAESGVSVPTAQGPAYHRRYLLRR